MSKKHVMILIILFFIGIASVAYNYDGDASGEELIDCDTNETQEVDTSTSKNKNYDKSVNQSDNTSDTSTKCKESEEKIFIHICGEVREPGVYELKQEARVIDAIKAAGGLTDDASVTAVNQAEKVTDGLQVYIPSKEEAEKDVVSSNSTSESSGKVNINTASQEELITLPGVGSAKASKIIEYRTTNGKFKKIEDIMNIPGIKEGLFNKISENITV